MLVICCVWGYQVPAKEIENSSRMDIKTGKMHFRFLVNFGSAWDHYAFCGWCKDQIRGPYPPPDLLVPFLSLYINFLTGMKCITLYKTNCTKARPFLKLVMWSRDGTRKYALGGPQCEKQNFFCGAVVFVRVLGGGAGLAPCLPPCCGGKKKHVIAKYTTLQWKNILQSPFLCTILLWKLPFANILWFLQIKMNSKFQQKGKIICWNNCYPFSFPWKLTEFIQDGTYKSREIVDMQEISFYG